MTLEEFKKHVYHTRLCIVVPDLNLKVNKTLFFKRGKLDIKSMNIYLEELYYNKYK